jgi:hypothetical protein
MRTVLIALGLWFGLEMAFVAILVAVSEIEGHRARREVMALEERYLRPSADRLSRLSAQSSP